jgi:hypothetical protein
MFVEEYIPFGRGGAWPCCYFSPSLYPILQAVSQNRLQMFPSVPLQFTVLNDLSHSRITSACWYFVSKQTNDDFISSRHPSWFFSELRCTRHFPRCARHFPRCARHFPRCTRHFPRCARHFSRCTRHFPIFPAEALGVTESGRYFTVSLLVHSPIKMCTLDCTFSTLPNGAGMQLYKRLLKENSVALVRERNIPTERPPLVGEVSVNFCG